MKTIVMGLALATGVAVTFLEQGESERARIAHDFPLGCIVAVAVEPGFLPRADLIVENRLGRPILVRLEGRAGSGLLDAELGTIGSQQRRIFAHALPAGRNTLIAHEEGSGRARRQVLYVHNHGASTCHRRSMARFA